MTVQKKTKKKFNSAKKLSGEIKANGTENS